MQDSTSTTSTTSSTTLDHQRIHDNLSIPVIRRVLQNIRTRWKDSSCQHPFSVYSYSIVDNHPQINIQRFCFHFVTNKYNRRHLKYMVKRQREQVEVEEVSEP